MRGLTDGERGLVEIILRWAVLLEAELEQVGQLVAQGRVETYPCPAGGPHKHARVTAAGRHAYELDTYARRGAPEAQ